jgi:hypothetical protein
MRAADCTAVALCNAFRCWWPAAAGGHMNKASERIDCWPYCFFHLQCLQVLVGSDCRSVAWLVHDKAAGCTAAAVFSVCRCWGSMAARVCCGWCMNKASERIHWWSYCCPPLQCVFAGAGGQRLQECGMADGQLVHIARREYVLACNWKVFCDNYLVSCACIHLPYV